MKEQSKLKTITNAWTKDADVSEEVFETRMEICGGCEYNSDNKKEADLTLFEKARKKTTSEPFCTACGCQLAEKLGQAVEQCGLVDIGLPAKWNKEKIITVGKDDLNLKNLSLDKVSIELSVSKLSFEVDYGQVNLKSDTNIALEIEGKNPTFVLISAKPGCGCTHADTIKVDNKYHLRTALDLNQVRKGEFKKGITLTYRVNKQERKVKIILKGVNNR